MSRCVCWCGEFPTPPLACVCVTVPQTDICVPGVTHSDFNFKLCGVVEGVRGPVAVAGHMQYLPLVTQLRQALQLPPSSEVGMAYLLSSLPSEAACTPHPHLPLLFAPSCAASLPPLALEVAPARLFIRCLCPHTEPLASLPHPPRRFEVSVRCCGLASCCACAGPLHDRDPQPHGSPGELLLLGHVRGVPGATSGEAHRVAGAVPGAVPGRCVGSLMSSPAT